MGAERGGEHLGGLSEDRVGRKCGGRDPDRAGGLLPKLAHGPKFRFDLLQPGAHRPEQAFSPTGLPSRRPQPPPEATISVDRADPAGDVVWFAPGETHWRG